MVFFTTMFTTGDVNIHALIAKYGIDIQIVRPEMTKFKMFREFSKHGYPAWIELRVMYVRSSSNNKTLNARLLARVITGCHYS
jgi:uroporphyrinogen-III synthase